MDKDRMIKRQLKRLEKQEARFLNRKDSYIKSKTQPVAESIQEKIPEKLLTTLENAFYKGFQLVFNKGSKYIEKTYNRDKLQLKHDLQDTGWEKYQRKRYIKGLDRQARSARTLNTGFSVLEGGVLGVLGIGLPDIPLLISVMIKTINETALSYGFEYESQRERAYILLLICGALTRGEEQRRFNDLIDAAGKDIDENRSMDFNLTEQMKRAAGILSESMLTAKFIQGIPIIGAVGSIANYGIIKRVGQYAGLKYKKRYLLKKA